MTFTKTLHVCVDMDNPTYEWALNFEIVCDVYIRSGEATVSFRIFSSGDQEWPRDTFTPNELAKIQKTVDDHDWELESRFRC